MGQPGQTSLSERLRSIEAEIAAGQAESALAHCQDIFAQYPRALAVQRVLGEIYLALRKPREALGALDRALAGDPEDARACCARAIIHQMHGDPVAALGWYRRACDARPDDQALRATYREMASRVDRPAYQPSRVGLARLYMRSALFTHAIREWETLIAENSDLLEAQVGLVETLWRTERTQEAEDWARRVLMNAPACVKPLLIVGVIARDTGRPTEADRYLQRAAELDPDHRIARALFADRAMGDTLLRTLFWGDEPVFVASSPSAPSAGQRASWGPQRTTGAPAVERQTTTERPTAERQTGMPTSAPTSPTLTGAPSLADLSAALSRPDLSANLGRPLPPPSRPQNLPPEFHSMFKETENMLWGPDHSDPGARPTMTMPSPQQPMQTGAPFMAPTGRPQSVQPPAAQPGFPPPAPPAPPMAQPMAPQQGMRPGGQPPFDGSAQFVPPAIVESQFALGDTETRRAIRWVQWLQAQGARMRSDEVARGRPTGSLDALLNTTRPGPAQGPIPGAPPPYPFPGRSTQLPVTSLPSTGPTVTGQPAPSAPGAPSEISSQTPSQAPSETPSETPSGFGPFDAFGPASAPSAPSAASVPGPGVSAPRSGPLTGPLPPPKPEDLRQMFAELAPTAQASDSADTGVADAPSAGIGAPLFDAPTFDEPAHRAATAPQLPDMPAEPAEATQPHEGEASWPEALADAFEWPSQPGAASPDAHADTRAALNANASPDLTLEALEGVHNAQGFQQFDLEPGSLAAFVGDTQGANAGGGEAARALDEFFQEPEQPPLPPVEPEAPAPVAQPSIAPTDYPARLAAARSLREAGSLDEALVEYRALLKNAPDLLPDVLSDLEASLDEQPEHPELHRLLGDARIRQGDYMAALESLNRSVSLTQPGDE